MRLVKHGHSCVRLEADSGVVVIDPGGLSHSTAALRGADAVLVTHEHFDHLDVEALRAAAHARPGLPVWGPSPVTAQLADLDVEANTVTAGDEFEAAGLAVRTFGGRHALVHRSIPVIPNVGFVVADTVCHPGDSFDVPADPVTCLLLPVQAPWSKIAEVIDYFLEVGAPRALPVHDGLLNQAGLNVIERLVGEAGAGFGLHFEPWPADAAVDLSVTGPRQAGA